MRQMLATRSIAAAGAFTVLLGLLSMALLIWTVGSTDNGMLCNYHSDGIGKPVACSLYEAPYWAFAGAALSGFITTCLLVRWLWRDRAVRATKSR